MSRGRYKFRQRELTRAIKAVEAAGVARIVRIDPRDGAITIVPVALADRQDEAPEGDGEWASVQ